MNINEIKESKIRNEEIYQFYSSVNVEFVESALNYNIKELKDNGKLMSTY